MSESPASPATEPAGGEPRGALSLLRQIQAGALSPKNLLPADRRACVEHLVGEGYAQAEIAEILQVSERTVIRDRKAIQESHALEHDPKLPGQVAGRLLFEAELCIGRIRKAGRDKAASPRDRIEGERACFQILDAAAARLQSLGYLPAAGATLHAELIHRLGVPEAELRGQLDDLAAIRERYRPGDADAAEGLRQTGEQLGRLLAQPPTNAGEADRAPATDADPERGAA